MRKVIIIKFYIYAQSNNTTDIVQFKTKQTLAEMSVQKPSNISHIERGATKLSLPTIVNIANALGVTVDDLLCDSLTASSSSYEHVAGDILSDCTHTRN